MGARNSKILTNGDIQRLSCPADKSNASIWDARLPGLGVRASKSGKKVFFLQHRVKRTNGDVVEFKKTLRDCSVLTLESARLKASELLQTISEAEKTPAEIKRLQAEAERKQTEEAQRLKERQKRYNFGELLNRYVEDMERRGRTSTPEVKNALRRHVFDAHPELVEKLASEITAQDCNLILKTMLDKGIKSQVDKVRRLLNAAFNLGLQAYDPLLDQTITNFGLTSNPVTLIPARSLAQLTKPRERYLNEAELILYLEKVRALPNRFYRLTLLFHFLTGGQRQQQLLKLPVRDAHVGERTFIKLEDPKGRRTSPRIHVVPVVGSARPVFEALLKRAKDKSSEFVFCSEVDPAVRLCPETLLGIGQKFSKELLDDGKIDEPFSIGTIRASVETYLASKRVNREERGHLQSHGIGGVQDKHYNRFDYWDPKVEALELLDGFFKANFEVEGFL